MASHGPTKQFDPERFLAAQTQIYSQALREIRAGKKQGHWMWFVFPQVAGLGASPMTEGWALEYPRQSST